MFIPSYFELGFDHILDPNGYDHILFVVVLAAAYKVVEWKKMLVLVTAFTLGHCLTLALSSLDMIKVSAELIETLIPITIIVSAIFNVWEALKEKRLFDKINYVLTLCIGLIHGLGFSNFFKALITPDESIVPLLLSFNIGVEVGQLLIVATVLILSWLWSQKMNHRYFTIWVSSLCAFISFLLLVGVL